jgi:hypothetical protein
VLKHFAHGRMLADRVDLALLFLAALLPQWGFAFAFAGVYAPKPSRPARELLP